MRFSRKYIIFTIIFAATIMIFVGSSLHRLLRPPGRNPLNLYSVQFANPHEDLKKSLAQQDKRFIGIRGYALVIPGITGGPSNEEVKRYGYRVVAGTTDALSAPWQGELQSRARSYAERYKLLLMEELRRSKPPKKHSINEIKHDRIISLIKQTPTTDRALKTLSVTLSHPTPPR